MLVVLSLDVCLLLVMAASRVGSAERIITCNGGIYAPGDTAVVVCNLHANMTDSKLSLTIVQSRLDAPPNDPGTDIVVCRWEKSKKKHECDVKEGYRFFDDVQDHPRLEIPSVDDASAGLYMCSNVPVEGTKSHPCEIVVKGTKGFGKKERDYDQEKDQSVLGYIAIPTVIAVGLLVGLVWLALKHPHARRVDNGANQTQRSSKDTGSDKTYELVPTEEVEACGLPFLEKLDYPNEKVKQYLEPFRLNKDDFEHVENCTKGFIHRRKSKGEDTTVIIQLCDALSLRRKTDKDQVVAVCFCSNLLTIVLINEHHPQAVYEIYVYPEGFKRCQMIQMFEFLAECIVKFARAHLPDKKLAVWFIIPFPCVHENLTKVRLVKWTKEFDCKGSAKKDLGSLLAEAMGKKNPDLELEIKVIINNAVATLVSAAHGDPGINVSLFLSNGVNACYLEKSGEWLAGSTEKGTPTEVVNTEFGALGDDGCLNRMRTEFDKDVDEHSLHRGDQMMEKMIGRMYITDIVKRVLMKLHSEGLLFTLHRHDSPLFDSKTDFQADFVSLIESQIFVPKGIFRAKNV